jgi:7,8-dihydropterin-6-yl-methyl-4-(beta-D-ribofuranosyl)aminobenzene 5'-phosphate synthase
MRILSVKLIVAAAVLASTASSAAACGPEGNKMLPLDNLSIRIIYDNTEPEEGFEADWGFSCVIEGAESTILFDTGGNGDIFMRNLDRAEIKASEIDIVVISHKHWDHIGGLSAFLSENPDVTVYVPASFSGELKKSVADQCAKLVEVDDPVEILPGVYSSGDMKGPVREQSLAIATDGGSIVITGCAHPGIDRIVERACEVTGENTLFVMGGFHLGNAGKKRLDEISSVFDKSGVRYCGASHCTGDDSIGYFRNRYGDRYVSLGAGRAISGDQFTGL